MTQVMDITDAFQEEDDAAPAPVAEDLEQALPMPPAPDADQLELESTLHRVVILRRGAVIAVTTLLSVGGAVFLHALFVGALALGIFFPASPEHGDGKTFVGAPDEGGAPIAFSAGDDALSGQGAAAGIHDAQGAASEVTAVASLALPDLPDVRSLSDPSAASATLPDMATPDELGTIKVKAPGAVKQITVSTPARAASVANPAGIGPKTSGAPAGNIGEGGFADEPVFGLRKGDGAGSGNGQGNGRGDGIDRGMSAANRDVQILGGTGTDSEFVLPMQYQLKPPEKSVELLITVLPDGSIGDIQLKQSCGIADLDNYVMTYVRSTLHFHPAVKEGKPITSVFEYGHSFRPFE